MMTSAPVPRVVCKNAKMRGNEEEEEEGEKRIVQIKSSAHLIGQLVYL
jgi:hypothetical protein